MTVEVEFLNDIQVFLEKLSRWVLRKHQAIEASMSCGDALTLVVAALDTKLGKVAPIAF